MHLSSKDVRIQMILSLLLLIASSILSPIDAPKGIHPACVWKLMGKHEHQREEASKYGLHVPIHSRRKSC